MVAASAIRGVREKASAFLPGFVGEGCLSDGAGWGTGSEASVVGVQRAACNN